MKPIHETLAAVLALSVSIVIVLWLAWAISKALP